MAKITTTSEGTKFDPNVGVLDEIQRLGLSPTRQTQEFSLQSQSDVLNAYSDIDLSEFKKGSSLYTSDSEARAILEEQRAREQGVLNQSIKGVGRVGTTMLTEILKTPGYVGGALGSSMMDGDFIENTVNNAWVNAFESLDESVKEMMPVYLTKDVQEGNIGRKLMSSAWWATTGADGVGFLLSMFAPGQALKSIGIGAKVAGGLEALAAANPKLAKVFTSNSILSKTLAGGKVTEKGIANIESASAVALNTFVESSAEAANTFDNVKKTFLEQNPNASEEDANKAAGEAAASVMKANIAVLSLSNLLDEVFLFKGFGQTAEKTAKDSILGKIFKDGNFDKEAIAQLKREGIREFSKKALPKLAANFAKEGMFEEGLQTRIQQHYEKKSDLGFWDDVVGGYFDGIMNDPEMQESVVLGGILGGGASLVSVANEIKGRNDLLFGKESSYPSMIAKFFNKKEKKESKGLLKILDDNFVNSFRTVHDIAELDKDGKPVFENGKVKIDEAKLKDMVDQKQNAILLSQLHNISILEGDKAEEDMFGDQLMFNYFMPFLQQEGGYEVLKQHIDSQLVDLMSAKVESVLGTAPSQQEKEKIKAKLHQRADTFHNIFQEVNTTTNTELHVKPANKNYGAWKESVRNRKLQTLIAYNSAEKALQDLNTKFPQDLDDDQLAAMNPVDVLKYAKSKHDKKAYTELLEESKKKYVELSSKKGLQEDYNKYNEEISKVEDNVVEELKKEDTPINNIASSADMENEIASAGYEVIRNQSMKGFYIKGEKIVMENEKGQRGVLESVYDPKTKESHQYFTNSSGNRTKITDENGNVKETFLKLGFKPVSKQKLGEELKRIALAERKETQLKLLQELINSRNNQIALTEKEIQDVEKQIEDFTTQLEAAKKEIAEVYNTRMSNKSKNVKKKQLKLREKTLQDTVIALEDTIKNLQKRRDSLYEIIPRIEILRAEYEKLKQEIANSDVFSFKQELKKVEEAMITDKDVSEIRGVISDIENKIKQLTELRDSILKTLASNKAFIKLIQLSEKEYTKAFGAFDNFFKDVPFPHSVQAIHRKITADLKETVAGETLAKNNIITNAIEITEWFNSNDVARQEKFGTTEPITELDVYNKIVELISPYADSLEDLQTKSFWTLEDIHEMQSKVFVTNREIDDLTQKLNEATEVLNLSDLYRKYVVLQRLMQERFEKRFQELQHEKAVKTLDFSQKQRGSFPEPTAEADMRDIFYQHALPSTPFSTTGISVLYEKDGARKGKDKIDENGYPELNSNEFQRLWFLTTDRLSDEISDYLLMPVKAKYDSSDDFQKAIEANFPDESQRSENDVFVFLVDKEGNPIKADKQGNLLKSGGNFVFTSIRKVDEVFPAGRKPKVAPDYIFNEYLKSIGIANSSYSYAKIKDKKVSDIATSKVAKTALAPHMDKTVEQLFDIATEWNREQYAEFVKQLGSQTGFLEIYSTTRGYPLYQVDKDGNKKQHKPLSVFTDVTLDKDLGVKQLKGATLGVTIKGPIMSKKQQITLPEGSIYMKFVNEEFVTLQSRNINDKEARMLLFLLSMADTVNPLNTITVPFPKKKNGDSYYYYLGDYRVTDTMPVFARRLGNGEPFSLIHTIINYGFKADNKNKKGEIYIQSGKIHFTDFDNVSHEIPLKQLSEAIQSDKFENYNDAIKSLFTFLTQKRFNVEKNLLRTNPIFMYPKLRKIKNGQYDIEFDTSKTYYEHILGDVLTTSATKKEGYPNHLQRNLVYDPKVKPIAKKASSVQTNKTTGTKPPAPSVDKDSTKEQWMRQKKQSLLKMRDIAPEMLDTEVMAKESFNKNFKPQLEQQSKDLKIAITDNDLNELFEVYFRGEKEIPMPSELEGILPKDTKTDVAEERILPKEEPIEKPMTAQEKLAALRNRPKQEMKPKSGMAKPGDASKNINVNELIDKYVDQGLIQKQCK